MFVLFFFSFLHFSDLFGRALLLSLSLCNVVCLSVCPVHSPKTCFHLQKKLSHFHFFMHFWMFFAILSAPKKISPQIFFHIIFSAEARRDTMLYQAFLVFFRSSAHDLSLFCRRHAPTYLGWNALQFVVVQIQENQMPQIF